MQNDGRAKKRAAFLHSTFYILHFPNSGQAAVFMLMALTVLAYMLLWKADLSSIIRAKDRAQNAGDAAALAGARWQVASLNLIGEMNLLHALAVLDEDDDASAMLEDMQARMCFAGPMAGLLAMQQAARQNRVHNNAEYTAFMREHANTVRFNYPVWHREPWPGAWRDYADMLDAIIAEGIAAGPDNYLLYGEFEEAHILADKAFYRAVDGRIWCWFFLNYGNPLDWYRGHYTDWPDLPPGEPPNPENCEFLGLRLQSRHTVLQSSPLSRWMPDFLRQADQLGFRSFPSENAPVMTNLTEVAHTWMFYEPGRWDAWDAMREEGFPIAGEVKPEFDYTGADSMARVVARSTRLSTTNRRRGGGNEQVDVVTWTAAAKPFGWLDEGDRRIPPTRMDMVLPAFHAARLIPVDAASEGSPGGFDL
ncbi:MAG: pilus assembly protein TadG-related protein, partial [Kiritimatiellaeota bacterium]|nr:pilus assembly protein TadG-related protein [Kiritimatiellota bacterium]